MKPGIHSSGVWKPPVVKIGDLCLGGNYPVRLQSMTNTDTLDTEATVAQAIRIYKAGGDMVRITTPGMPEAENLLNIKKSLRKKGYLFPIIADVHFNPKVAEYCAGIVEKIRINPGNYTDKKTGKTNYSESEYNSELDKINTRVTPLLKICKEHGTALRIGSNHGSLSERIMDRYGDTPLGMAESAMEFLRICNYHSFGNIVVSMKASNIRTMVLATRLLVKKMMEENLCFPVHLGVTEAGNNEDGRIKSACGIGALLADGIGDTIRVSLTEAPEKEIPVARAIAGHYFPKRGKTTGPLFSRQIHNPFIFEKNQTKPVLNIGGENLPVVITDCYNFRKKPEKPDSDFFYTGNQKIEFNKYPGQLFIADFQVFEKYPACQNLFPLFSIKEIENISGPSGKINFIKATCKDATPDFFGKINQIRGAVLLLKHVSLKQTKEFFSLAKSNHCNVPVIIEKTYSCDGFNQLIIESSCDFGPLFTDGFCDGIFIKNKNISRKKTNQAAFGILQATRARISRTEYISCPACGRTRFKIEKILNEVKKKTAHLKGLKIAVMGCIVNGPGEMADADYGCVGAGFGKVNLYKGKTVVKKNIETENAVEELLHLINTSG